MMRIKLLPVLMLMLMLVLMPALAGCGGDPPPDNGTKEPPALNGTYLCEGLGYLSFNGDGRTIKTEITGPSLIAGLPEGENEGTYVFLFRNEEWRYDLAETLRITVGEKSYEAANVHGVTNEKQIALLKENGEVALFVKEE